MPHVLKIKNKNFKIKTTKPKKIYIYEWGGWPQGVAEPSPRPKGVVSVTLGLALWAIPMAKMGVAGHPMHFYLFFNV
jgi:hypothetical protein